MGNLQDNEWPLLELIAYAGMPSLIANRQVTFVRIIFTRAIWS